MAVILCLETSTTNCSVAVAVDGNSNTILAGMTVTGSGITGIVTVASLSSQTSQAAQLVLSSAQTLSDNVVLTFTKKENSTTIAIDNKSGTISVGMLVTGAGIDRTVIVTAIAGDGNSITISQPELLTDNTALTFKITTITISAALTSTISNVRVTSSGSVFGGKVQNIFSTQTVGTGFTTAIQFKSTSQDPPFSLDTAMLEYATKSRR